MPTPDEPLQISELPAVTAPAAQLPGSRFAVDVPNPAYNPVAPGTVKRFLTRYLGFGDLLTLLQSVGPATNAQRGTPKIVLHESSTAAGVGPNDSSLDRLAGAVLCVGTEALVLLPEPHRLVLAKDPTGPLTVAIDGSFPGPTTNARWAAPEDAYALGEVAFSPLTAEYAEGARVNFRINGQLRLFSAARLLRRPDFAGNRIPDPGSSLDWEEVSPPGGAAYSPVVVLSQAVFANLYENTALGGYSGKLLAITDRPDGKLVYLACAASGAVNYADAYELDPATGAYLPVRYDVATDTTGPRAGGIGGGPATTDALPEGFFNLYFTTARAQAAARETEGYGLQVWNADGIRIYAGNSVQQAIFLNPDYGQVVASGRGLTPLLTDLTIRRGSRLFFPDSGLNLGGHTLTLEGGVILSGALPFNGTIRSAWTGPSPGQAYPPFLRNGTLYAGAFLEVPAGTTLAVSCVVVNDAPGNAATKWVSGPGTLIQRAGFELLPDNERLADPATVLVDKRGGSSAGATGPWPSFTNPVTDDVNNFYRATCEPNFRTTDAESTRDGGLTAQVATESQRSGNVFSLAVGVGPVASGQAGWRLRASGGRPAGPWLFNIDAFAAPAYVELLPNPDFSQPATGNRQTGWECQPGLSMPGDGFLTGVNPAGGTAMIARTTAPLLGGRSYRLGANIIDLAGGTLNPQIRWPGYPDGFGGQPIFTQAGQVEQVITLPPGTDDGNSWMIFYTNSNLVVDSVTFTLID